MSDVVSLNKRYQALLGWTFADLGLAEMPSSDDDLALEIREVQRQHGLEVDGVCGPKTMSAALALRQSRLVTATYATPEDRLAAAGIAAVCEAKRGWLKGIVDLPAKTSTDYERCRSFIDETIRTTVGLDWSWEQPYLGSFEWCGAYLARAWGAAGIKISTRRSFFSSTYRLDRWARYQSFENTVNPRPANGPYRMLVELNESSFARDAVFADGTLPRPGDILLVGGAGTAYGKHICLVESYTPGSPYITTVEGNGTGSSPGGAKMHGVVRAQRRIGLLDGANPTTYHARRLIRPAPSDLL